MIRHVLADDPWADALAEPRQCGLTALFWVHLLPCGRSASTWPTGCRCAPDDSQRPGERGRRATDRQVAFRFTLGA
jgi:hypothetical protein